MYVFVANCKFKVRKLTIKQVLSIDNGSVLLTKFTIIVLVLILSLLFAYLPAHSKCNLGKGFDSLASRKTAGQP